MQATTGCWPTALLARQHNDAPRHVASLRPCWSPQHSLLAAQHLLAGRSILAAVRGRTCQPVLASAAAAAEAPASSNKLAELELSPILNAQGYIQPKVSADTEASVFAIYDDKKKLQYVGFSKDIRNSLRTVFSRRPDKAFFYKAAHLKQLDQQEMVGIRTAWFAEVGGPPPGNKLAMERTAWQSPVSAGAISERGKQQAAEEQMKALLAAMATRGCKEEFLPNAALLAEGQVDFLASKEMTAEELQAQRATLAAAARASRTVAMEVNGQPAQFALTFRNTYKTNGGYMFDVVVSYEEQDTKHRVIVGKEYYEPYGVEAEKVVERAFSFLLTRRELRQTEGMLPMGQFPVNYFSISELDQAFDDFGASYADIAGRPLDSSNKFWRFNRIHQYGGQGENLDSLTLAINRRSDSQNRKLLEDFV